MFKLDSEKALVSTFRPRDRDLLELPLPAELANPGKPIPFPLFVRDYLAWQDPGLTRVFLVFSTPGGAPTGLVLRRSNAGEPGHAMMCDLCHTYGGGDQIGLLTAERNSKKRVGMFACLDLSCRQKLEDAANRGGKNPVESSRELLARMGAFAQDALGIDLSGVGRDATV